VSADVYTRYFIIKNIQNISITFIFWSFYKMLCWEGIGKGKVVPVLN
jgi:hypothetical protein